MARSWADQFIKAFDGPFAIVRKCQAPGCCVSLVTRKPHRPGRGWGFREGNRLRGAMIQHIREAHPELGPDGPGIAKRGGVV